ncbi:ParB/RepB/Spo0J family partition protein [Lachnotalea glycerini]|uniref:DUF3850 domain-containing protein n=1 Tax=Lachnotalea glycerini TaxID=1763509 RepID=A0A371JBN3_9FIRM|nr:DUF3850 domain-containing protein [Lachnotalea glycerini]RDY30170.1 DUF3850 domain-containing protein [Lachnotalea glycerini]
MPDFNVLNLMNSISKASIETNVDEYTEILLDLDDIVPSKENFYSQENIEELASAIEAAELQQPLVLGRVNGKYRLISGHRRRLALLKLVESGKEQFKKVQCRYKDMTETFLQFSLLVGNAYTRELNDYEKVEQTKQLREVIMKLKQEGIEIKGEIRNYIAGIMNESPTKIAQIDVINKKATEEVKEQFKEGNLNFTATYEASKLGKEEQKELAEKAAAGEDIKANEIKIIYQEKKAANEVNIGDKSNKPSESDGLKEKNNQEPTKIEQNAPEKVIKTKIYKKGEPREAITHYIKCSAMFFEDAAAERKNFELRINDCDYRVGDILHMTEHKDGHNTGRFIEQEIIYMLEEFNGLKDDYCILGTKLIAGIEQE